MVVLSSTTYVIVLLNASFPGWERGQRQELLIQSVLRTGAQFAEVAG